MQQALFSEIPSIRFNSGFKNWEPKQLPNLSGKYYVITGGNSGIGFEAAKLLGEAGANIILACRCPIKAKSAQEKISEFSEGSVKVVIMDLSDIYSIRKASQEMHENFSSIDGLINNAGVMQTPEQRTADGFEMQFGTNHLGHFLWTALMFDLVKAANGRVVVVSSLAHKYEQIDFSDVMSEKQYSPSKAYQQSKLANLMFAIHLDRRLKESHIKVKCIACHPGYASTNIQNTGPNALFKLLYKLINPFIAQTSYKGAIPIVLAAAGEEAKSGGYYGPQSFAETSGFISDAKIAPAALNEQNADRLWKISEDYLNHIWQI